MEQIIHAIQSDIEEIEYIMRTAWDTTENKDWYVTDDSTFLERHIEEEGYILKYTSGEAIAGFLVVRHPGLAEDNLGRYLPDWTEKKSEQVAHMESAAVLPEFRGQKIQQKLLLSAEEQERKSGINYLMATVHPDNLYSRRNLEQLGYMEVTEVEKYGGLRRKILCKKLF